MINCTEFLHVWYLGCVKFNDGVKRVLFRGEIHPYNAYNPWVEYKPEYELRRAATMLEF